MSLSAVGLEELRQQARPASKYTWEKLGEDFAIPFTSEDGRKFYINWQLRRAKENGKEFLFIQAPGKQRVMIPASKNLFVLIAAIADNFRTTVYDKPN